MNRRVLIVDDDPQIRNALELALVREGYEVITADGGDSAYAVLSDTPVDVILLDLSMPQLPGDALFLAIVRRWPGLARRVILMTGDSDPDSADWPDELKACPILAKPFRLQDLYTAVQSALPEDEVPPLRHSNGK
jgi:DNA-binding NtrC family response regulator